MKAPGAEPTDALGVDDVRSRAASGLAVMGARGVLTYGVGIVVNLVLARLLAPRDFGLVALGTVVLVLGTYLAEGGFGASLIRRKEPPLDIELRSVQGLQLGLTTTVAVAALCIGAAVGRDGLVVATMIASLPVAILKAPSVIVLERQLHYRVIATCDLVEALTYYLWAVVAVALGAGVWGMATAVFVRAIAGTGTMFAIGPLGLLRPRWSWPHVRPLIGFGAKVQATSLLLIAREQGLNVLVAAVSGVATLGVWNLAWRVIQIPNLLFLTVARVAFPAASRLIGAGHDPRPAIERGLAAIAAMTGIVVAGLVGLAVALPVLVGDEWRSVPAVLLWSGVALILGAPIAVATPGYLFAAGEATVVAVATLLSAVVWFGVAWALLPRHGAPAIGLGWVAAQLVNVTPLWRRTAARSGAAIGTALAAPTAIGLVAAAAGWLVAHRFDDRLAGGVVGAVAAELVMLAGLAVAGRGALRDTRGMSAQALASFRGRGSTAQQVAEPATATPGPRS